MKKVYKIVCFDRHFGVVKNHLNRYVVEKTDNDCEFDSYDDAKIAMESIDYSDKSCIKFIDTFLIED